MSALNSSTTRPGEPDPHVGLLGWAWALLIDSRALWGSLDVRPDRFGTRYLLVVYPPGITATERRRVRIWRGWPLWGTLLALVMAATLGRSLGTPTAVGISIALSLSVGALVFVRAGQTRTRVRTVGGLMLATAHDPKAAQTCRRIETLAATMLQADGHLRAGDITPTEHELIWWSVYDAIAHRASR
ncbi:DUF6611 family protein [Mycolicibacterium confluentis]|uniref:Uncharacterized protein n=1 Tax=Mycolicibacterium confluentis TaxID=28047 RepID=A0A7I7XRZ4_9MYCO|nr:DUF6611 family protein [Mycolicibacterium confluentis]MCV7318895.1 hypothetical protein [Mycolicibacterium confluentis]ORV23005.1 hypothetical protein AWB99_24025 [Mycolicibacterium confluentis]BBZ32046.1 hypothetical protein MCNF_06510 [Mycolicibacterium confluentis]